MILPCPARTCRSRGTWGPPLPPSWCCTASRPTFAGPRPRHSAKKIPTTFLTPLQDDCLSYDCHMLENISALHASVKYIDIKHCSLPVIGQPCCRVVIGFS